MKKYKVVFVRSKDHQGNIEAEMKGDKDRIIDIFYRELNDKKFLCLDDGDNTKIIKSESIEEVQIFEIK